MNSHEPACLIDFHEAGRLQLVDSNDPEILLGFNPERNAINAG